MKIHDEKNQKTNFEISIFDEDILFKTKKAIKINVASSYAIWIPKVFLSKADKNHNGIYRVFLPGDMFFKLYALQNKYVYGYVTAETILQSRSWTSSGAKKGIRKSDILDYTKPEEHHVPKHIEPIRSEVDESLKR